MVSARTSPKLARILRSLQEQLDGVSASTARQLVKVTAEAAAELEAQLKTLAPGKFTSTEVASKLVQVRAIQRVVAGQLGTGMGNVLTKQGKISSKVARASLIQQIAEAEHLYGLRPVKLAEATGVLAPGLLEHYQTSRLRYGSQAITDMRASLSQSLLMGESIAQASERMAQRLVLEPYRAERIARTETSLAGHRAELEMMRQVAADGDPWRKELVTLFDNRTGADSVKVHGQQRDLEELFHSPDLGTDFLHPPDRPNDRGTMIFVPVDIPGPMPPEAEETTPEPEPEPQGYAVPTPPQPQSQDLAGIFQVVAMPRSLDEHGKAAQVYATAATDFQAAVTRRAGAWQASKEQALADLAEARKAGKVTKEEKRAHQEEINKRWAAAKPDTRSALLELISTQGGGTIPERTWRAKLQGNREQADNGAKHLSQLVSADAWKHYELDKLKPAKIRTKAYARAYFRPERAKAQDTILVRTGEPGAVLVHEMGHWLEERSSQSRQAQSTYYTRWNSHIGTACKGWRDYRAQGEPKRLLRDITGIKSYSTREVAWEDRFWEPYMGKDYGAGNASEVFSMGVQELLTSANVERLIQRDPEHAGLIFHLLLGKVR